MYSDTETNGKTVPGKLLRADGRQMLLDARVATTKDVILRGMPLTVFYIFQGNVLDGRCTTKLATCIHLRFSNKPNMGLVGLRISRFSEFSIRHPVI